MTIYGYSRCSHNPQKLKVSPQSQLEAIQEKCYQLQLSSAEVIHDNASGKNLERQGIQEIITLIKQDKVSILITWKLNRLSRKTLDLLTIQSLCETYDVRLISVSEDYDSDDRSAQDTFKLQVLASVSELQRSIVSENIQSTLKLKHAKGLPLSANVPYGYIFTKEKLVIDKRKAPQIKRIFELYLSGKGYKKIVRFLNQELQSSDKDELFSVSLVQRILSTETYTGYFNNKYGRVQGVHDAIITPEIFKEVQRMKAKKTPDRVPLIEGFILRGMLLCPYCCKKLTVQVVNTKGICYRYYNCQTYVVTSKCRPFTVNADKLDQEVMSNIQSFLLESEVWQQIKGNVTKQIREQQNNVKKQLNQLSAQETKLFARFQKSIITSDTLQSKLQQLSEQRLKLETTKTTQLTTSAIKELISRLDSKETSDWTDDFISKLVEKVSLTKEKSITSIYLKKLDINIMERG